MQARFSWSFVGVLLVVDGGTLNKCIYKERQSEDFLGLALGIWYGCRAGPRAGLRGEIPHGGFGIGKNGDFKGKEGVCC